MRLTTKEGGERRLHMGIGAILITVGCVVAIASIPDNYAVQGALTLSGGILAFALLAPTILSWRNNSSLLLRGENILLAALVYWVLLDVLQGAYSLPVSRDAVVREFALLGVTALGFWVGATAGKPVAPKFLVEEAVRHWSPGVIFLLVSVAFLLGAWDFFYRADFDLDVVIQSLYSPRWETPWQREALGDWSAFSYHMQYFGYLVPALAVLLALRAGLRNPATWIAIAMAVTTLALHAQGGGRRIVGAMILAGIFAWLLHVRRLNTWRAVLLGASIVMLALMMQTMLAYRSIGLGDEYSGLASFDYLHVDDNFLRIGQMLEFVPDFQPFVGFQYLFYTLVRPIPRAVWPDKPIEGGFDLAELLGIPSTSFAITAAGEFYVSYGYPAALFGGLVYGRLARMVNALLQLPAGKLNPLYPGLMLIWLFVGVRSMLEIMLMGYVLLALLLLSRLVKILDSWRARIARAA